MNRFFSLDDMIRCSEREVLVRKRFYPRWVQEGKMKQADADWQTECMEAIVTKLKNFAGRRE